MPATSEPPNQRSNHKSNGTGKNQAEKIRGESHTSLTKKAEPPPTRDVNRDSGTASANGGWLRRIVRPRGHISQIFLIQITLLTLILARCMARGCSAISAGNCDERSTSYSPTYSQASA